MLSWSETYRGAASPWECDVTEHFTLAFYFDRVAMAEANLAAELGLVDTLRAGGFDRRYDVRLARELLAGSAFHIESTVLDAADAFAARPPHGQFGERRADDLVRYALARRRAAAGERGGVGRAEFAARPEPSDLSGLIPSWRAGPARRPRRIRPHGARRHDAQIQRRGGAVRRRDRAHRRLHQDRAAQLLGVRVAAAHRPHAGSRRGLPQSTAASRISARPRCAICM